MSKTGEKFLSKAAVCREMNISRARYEQLVEAGMLGKPILLKEGSRPVHTQTQIELANDAIYQKSCAGYLENQRRLSIRGAKPIKPISDSLIAGRKLYLEGKASR